MNNYINEIYRIFWHDINIRDIYVNNKLIKVDIDYDFLNQIYKKGGIKTQQYFCLVITTNYEDVDNSFFIIGYKKLHPIHYKLEDIITFLEDEKLDGDAYLSSANGGSILFHVFSLLEDLELYIEIRGCVDIKLERDKYIVKTKYEYSYNDHFVEYEYLSVVNKLFEYDYKGAILSRIVFKRENIIISFPRGVGKLDINNKCISKTSEANMILTIDISADEKASNCLSVLCFDRKRHWIYADDLRNLLKEKELIVDNIYCTNISYNKLFITAHFQNDFYYISILSCVDLKIIFEHTII